jgi:DNA polymerase III subunit beta
VKITATAAALAGALSLAGAAVRSKKDATPVRLAAADGAVSVTCTGSAITISATIAADVIATGQIAVAAEKLAELAAGFAPTAKLAISAAAGFATIVSGNSKSRLSLIPADDVPDALAIDSETDRVEISGDDLLTLLSPLPAADTEKSRYYLVGVHWCSDNGRLIATATNGSRLLRTSVEAAATLPEAGLILPSESAHALAKGVKATKPDRVTLRASKRLLAVDGDSFGFVSKLIDYPFPDTSRVIPKPSPNYLICKPADLLAALRRIVAVATSEAPLIALSFDGTPSLHVALARQPNDGSDTIEAEATGTARVVAVPAQFIAMLSQFESDHVRIEVTSDQQPVTICDGDKLALVLPCKWNWEAAHVA